MGSHEYRPSYFPFFLLVFHHDHEVHELDLHHFIHIFTEYIHFAMFCPTLSSSSLLRRHRCARSLSLSPKDLEARN